MDRTEPEPFLRRLCAAAQESMFRFREGAVSEPVVNVLFRNCGDGSGMVAQARDLYPEVKFVMKFVRM